MIEILETFITRHRFRARERSFQRAVLVIETHAATGPDRRPAKGCEAFKARDQKDVGGKNDQVHEAIEDVAPAGSEGECADQQGDEQEHHGLAVEPEDEVASEIQSDAGYGRHCQPDCGERRPKSQVYAALKLVHAGRPERRNAFREENEQRNEETRKR